MDKRESAFDVSVLTGIMTTRMPFGKYKGHLLRNIPEYYLLWMQQKGFPPGKLGAMLATLYEIKLNGLEYLLDGLAKSTERSGKQ